MRRLHISFAPWGFYYEVWPWYIMAGLGFIRIGWRRNIDKYLHYRSPR